jgi:hypothetical protein
MVLSLRAVHLLRDAQLIWTCLAGLAEFPKFSPHNPRLVVCNGAMGKTESQFITLCAVV